MSDEPFGRRLGRLMRTEVHLRPTAKERSGKPERQAQPPRKPLAPSGIGGWLVGLLHTMALLVAVGATLAGIGVIGSHAGIDMSTGSSSISGAIWLAGAGLAVGGWIVALGLAWAAYVLKCLSAIELSARGE